MSLTEEAFNPAALQRSDTAHSTITVASKTLPSLATKASRPQSHPRIDFEPLYTDLKTLTGRHWGVYYDALTRFIRGGLRI
jgi:transcriptional coactivator HFI1/ADA1